MSHQKWGVDALVTARVHFRALRRPLVVKLINEAIAAADPQTQDRDIYIPGPSATDLMDLLREMLEDTMINRCEHIVPAVKKARILLETYADE